MARLDGGASGQAFRVHEEAGVGQRGEMPAVAAGAQAALADGLVDFLAQPGLELRPVDGFIPPVVDVCRECECADLSSNGPTPGRARRRLVGFPRPGDRTRT